MDFNRAIFDIQISRIGAKTATAETTGDECFLQEYAELIGDFHHRERLERTLRMIADERNAHCADCSAFLDR